MPGGWRLFGNTRKECFQNENHDNTSTNFMKPKCTRKCGIISVIRLPPICAFVIPNPKVISQVWDFCKKLKRRNPNMRFGPHFTTMYTTLQHDDDEMIFGNLSHR